MRFERFPPAASKETPHRQQLKVESVRHRLPVTEEMEIGLKQAESSQERFKVLRKGLERLAVEVKSPMAFEMIMKMLSKLQAKEVSDELKAHWDDETFQDLKGLGIFIAHYRHVTTPMVSPNGVIDLRPGDAVLELHIPPVEEKDKKKLLSLARQSLKKVAGYIKQHDLEPRYVLGMTYEALADLAPAFGFETEDIPLPEEVEQAVKLVYEQFVPAKKIESDQGPLEIVSEGPGKIRLVYMKTEDFLKKWGV